MTDRARQIARELVAAYEAGLQVTVYAKPAEVLEGMIARALDEHAAERLQAALGRPTQKA